jgi:PAS domain S-box-containing protein
VNSVGSAERLAIRHLNGSGELCSTDLQRRLPLLGAMVARAIDSGSTQLSPGIQAATSPRRRNPEARPIFDPTPWIIVPIATGKGVCGAITFVFDTSEATVNPQLTITAKDIARRAASAIDRVLFYQEAQEVAEHSRQIANQLQQLLGASLQVARLVDRAEVLRVIARRATAICNAAGAIIAVTASDGESIRAISELDEEVRIGGPELRPFTIDLPDELTLADGSSLPARTLITPITGSDGGSIGSLVIWRTEGANFTKEDETVLDLLAQTASTSLSSTEMYQAIQSSEARWRTLIESAPIGIIEVDTRGTVLWANHSAAAIFGGLTENKIGLNAPPLAASSHLSSLELLWSRAITGAAVHDRELVAVEIGGELRDLLVSVVPLYDSNNSVEGILTLASDISERRRLEADLQQAQRMEAVGQLAGNVAHDFNNLLTLISGYTELLRSIDLMDEKALGLVESIQGVTDRAAMLTGRLLTISRSQSARAQTFDLIEAVGAKIEVLGTILGEEVHLVHEIPKERGYVSMDPAYFDQMILNLAVNARDAMPEGGVFTISIQRRRVGQLEATRLGVRHGELFELILSDTGIGMDAATEARCFEPFFTTKGPTKGTGLGLAAVRSVIVESGGSIEVHSAPGNSTSFVILLPAAAPPIPSAVEEPVSAMAARENHELSILVAEDDEGLRSMITKVISQAGFQVHSAPAGDLALDLARSLEDKPQLLVTDVAMPGLNGPELARYVLELSPATAVLFISSNTSGIAVPPSRAGHISFLAKPFRPSDLLKRIYEILDACAEPPLE